MKYALITAALVCFASLNSADAGLFGRNNNNNCCGAQPSCCAPAPTCAAPAACAPTCAAPAACAPACAAPAACAPTCAAPVACAPVCAAPAPTCCPQNACCGKAKKQRFSMSGWMSKLRSSRKNNNCCNAAPSCGYAGPTCAAPCAPSCAVPAAACCH
ncbi:MAG: hypothetical protein SH850_28780 [Planctomycetaceae bacterium]|nr:hypothetical protein [Planctomycetaceae bacterium]